MNNSHCRVIWNLIQESMQIEFSVLQRIVSLNSFNESVNVLCCFHVSQTSTTRQKTVLGLEIRHICVNCTPRRK